MLSLLSIIAFVLFATAILAGGSYVGMIKKDKTINSAWRNIKNILNRRYDLFYFLIDIIKSYYEETDEVLDETLEIINTAANVENVEERAEIEDEIYTAVSEIVEIYGNDERIANDQNFSNIIFSILDNEKQLQNAKDFYNENTAIFNETVNIFPIALAAKKLNLNEKGFFDYRGEIIEDETEFENDEFEDEEQETF